MQKLSHDFDAYIAVFAEHVLFTFVNLSIRTNRELFLQVSCRPKITAIKNPMCWRFFKTSSITIHVKVRVILLKGAIDKMMHTKLTDLENIFLKQYFM